MSGGKITGNRLRKEEILRGFESYADVLKNSVKFRSGILNAFLRSQEKNKSDLPGNFKSPLFTPNVKVGFIIAKKKIRKAVRRNRIRRILKELYRLNKTILNHNQEIKIIFSLSDKGYEICGDFSRIKYSLFEKDFTNLLLQVNKFVSKE